MSDLKKKEIKIEFKISNIDLLEKSFNVPVLNSDKIPLVQFDLALNVSVDKPNKKISDILFVKVKLENSDTIVASISVSCTFDIVNFEEIVISHGDSATIPDTILETLHIITIGTTRGVLFNELKGTWLHNTILPIIDPKSFKQEQFNNK